MFAIWEKNILEEEKDIGRSADRGYLACTLAAITQLTFGLITTSRSLTARSVTSLFLSRNCILVFLLVKRITPVSCQFVCTIRVTTAPRRIVKVTSRDVQHELWRNFEYLKEVWNCNFELSEISFI